MKSLRHSYLKTLGAFLLFSFSGLVFAQTEADVSRNESASAVTQEQGRKEHFRFEGRYWMTRLKASASVIETFNGTDIGFSFVPALKARQLPDGRLTWQIARRHRLALDYFQAGFAGGPASLGLSVNGQQFVLNTGAISRLSLRQGRLAYAWQLFGAEKRIRFGVLADVRGLWVENILREPESNLGVINPDPQQQKESFLAVLPGAGGEMNVKLHRRFDVFASASGLPLGKRGSLLDAEAGIRVSPVRHLSVTAGYRVLDFNARHENAAAAIRLAGMFVGTQFRF